MSHDIRIVTETELRQAIDLDRALVDVIENCFRTLDGGEVIMPPILSMDLTRLHGEVDVKTAWLPGLDSFAIKASTGFYGNAELGLPSLGGLMVVLSAKTGVVEAVLLDNGYLTDLRTAAAGAVAARHMAPKATETAGVLGTGLQARLQIRAAALERDLKRVLVWGRDPDKARACAADLAGDLNIPCTAMTDPAALVAESQLVITTTPANTPILKADWLHAGLHITAMGSDAPGKNEIETAALARADAYVCDRLSQCETLGELRAHREAGLTLRADPVELGAVVAGAATGRASEQAITIADLTGTGAQDTAIATHVLRAMGTTGTTIRT